jgi:DNA helicase-2/ATP-dependent DNA helicase PcrA
MLEALEKIRSRSIKLNDSQKKVIKHNTGPLRIIAGPGSGKTEVLILRCLKLLLVDGVNPKSIIATTFTEKAAKNLQDRLTNYKFYIANAYPDVSNVDLFQLRCGTLHSLCNDIMVEYGFPGYKNYRPIDDMEQLMFIFFHSKLSEGPSKLSSGVKKLWEYFEYVWTSGWKGSLYKRKGWQPTRWMRAQAAQTLFNRITEDLLNIDAMKMAGKSIEELAFAYEAYEEALDQYYRVDFAHMQKKFLSFLETPLGEHFLKGNGTKENPGIRYVLVDEYQDTNPIQEAIYLKLADAGAHNIAVVGDDDQALYRFRGATVESMINFDTACKSRWGCNVLDIPMVDNYRSHTKIVDWVNDYIDSFVAMKKPGARVGNKPRLIWNSKIKGDWPAVAVFTSSRKKNLGLLMADTVRGLLDENIVLDPSDCVLLMRSTRETSTWSKYFVEALWAEGIPVYNPRSRQYLEQEEIQILLGALLEIVDPKPDYNFLSGQTKKTINIWREVYNDSKSQYPDLSRYVTKSKNYIRRFKGDYLGTSLQEIAYHIISFEPFRTWLEEPERTIRIGEFTRLLEAFCSTPIPGYPGLSRGNLQMSNSKPGELNWMWKTTFYASFISLILDTGLNDPEEEDIIAPKGFLPVMTIHQSKGLEFPFVFVDHLEETWGPELQHMLEDEFMKYRRSPIKLASSEDRAKQDLIRFFYVAYSRARYALVIFCEEDKMKPGEKQGDTLGLGGKDLRWLKDRVELVEE